MKLGIVSDEQFLKELENGGGKLDPIPLPTIEIKSDNQIIEKTDDPKTKGRKLGDINVPENLRKLIGEEGVINGRQAALALASDFGISPSSASAYAVGSTSTKSYHNPKDTLTNYLQARKNRITKKSLRILTSALDTLTPEKLNGIRAKDASSIAKDMSTIVNNMSDGTSEASSNKPQFVIYAPQVRDERSYETIVVTDNF